MSNFKYPEYTWRKPVIPKIERSAVHPLFPNNIQFTYGIVCCFEVKEIPLGSRKPYDKYIYQIWLYPNEYTKATAIYVLAEKTLIFGCASAYNNWRDSEIQTWIRGALTYEQN